METFDFKQAILSAKGDPEVSNYILESDLQNIVNRAIYVKDRRDKFPTFIVNPVSDFEKGLKLGKFSEIKKDSLASLKIKKQKSFEPKKIFLASFDEAEIRNRFKFKSLQRENTLDLLKEYKLKPVEYHVYYFLGLMAMDVKDLQVTKACHKFSGLNGFTIFAKEDTDQFESPIGVEIGFNPKNNYLCKEIASFCLVPPCHSENFFMFESE